MMEAQLTIKVDHLSKCFTRTVKSEDKKSLFKGLNKLTTKKEDFFAVDDISFSASKGEIYGILGPNGAGKTTLLRMLGSILTPTTGSIEVLGKDYQVDKESAKKQIGYLSGNTKLYGRLSPRELFKTFGRLYEMSEEEIEHSINQLIEVMDLGSFIDNRIEHLSTGQTQRTSIARCLLHAPELYIFDEPTLGLDVLSSRDIISFMKEERNKGKTVLYSTHYMEEAETLCDHILMIHEGKIIAQGSPDELKAQVGVSNLRDAFFYFAEQGEAAV